jgi:hypothetical protein
MTVDADDHNPCTTDSCDPLTGVKNTPINTDDGEECTIDSCNPITGVMHINMPNFFPCSQGTMECMNGHCVPILQ